MVGLTTKGPVGIIREQIDTILAHNRKQTLDFNSTSNITPQSPTDLDPDYNQITTATL